MTATESLGSRWRKLASRSLINYIQERRSSKINCHHVDKKVGVKKITIKKSVAKRRASRGQ